MVAPHGLSVGMGSGKNKELLSLRSVQATGRTTRQQKGLIAVAHSLLVIGYHLQRKGCAYQELGGDYFDQLHAERLKRHLVKRLKSLGVSVTLQALIP